LAGRTHVRGPIAAFDLITDQKNSAHFTEELAAKEVLEILDLYAAVYKVKLSHLDSTGLYWISLQELLAVPVVRGKYVLPTLYLLSVFR
jgi:hypothetical protein